MGVGPRGGHCGHGVVLVGSACTCAVFGQNCNKTQKDRFLPSAGTDTDTCLLRGPPPRTPTNSVSSWFRFGFPPWVASAHRGTGVAVVLLTHPRVLLSHTHGLTGLSV